MSLQLLPGRESKPPLRTGDQKPVASPTLQTRTAKEIPQIGKAKAKPALRFPVSPETRAFYRRFYPGTTTTEWNDWHWQFQARVRSSGELQRIFKLSDD